MAMVTDPVCGMNIDSEEAAGTIEYEGKTYYFCSQVPRCLRGRSDLVRDVRPRISGWSTLTFRLEDDR